MHMQKYTLPDINTSVCHDFLEIIDIAEKRYQNAIEDVAKRVVGAGNSEIIMLAGPSSSGKTTTAEKIAEAIMKKGVSAYTISLDDFYADREAVPKLPNGKPDYETVYALDLPLVSKCLNEFITYGKTELPIFDFEKGVRAQHTNILTLGDGDVIIVEGLHALNPVITEHLPQDNLLKIYISVASRIYDHEGSVLLSKRNIRFIRRAVRDYYFRNSSIENTCRLWENVEEGENKYLFPFKDSADIKINSIHEYEPCVFTTIAPILFAEIESDSIYYEHCKKITETLKQFEPLPISAVPKDSLLREFIGK